MTVSSLSSISQRETRSNNSTNSKSASRSSSISGDQPNRIQRDDRGFPYLVPECLQNENSLNISAPVSHLRAPISEQELIRRGMHRPNIINQNPVDELEGNTYINASSTDLDSSSVNLPTEVIAPRTTNSSQFVSEGSQLS